MGFSAVTPARTGALLKIYRVCMFVLVCVGVEGGGSCIKQTGFTYECLKIQLPYINAFQYLDVFMLF